MQTNNPFFENVLRGCRQLVYKCAVISKDDTVLIVADNDTKELGKLLQKVSSEITSNISLEVIKPLGMHGTEPPDYIASAMLNSNVVFGITTMSMAHTRARKNASDAKVRYLSLPQYSHEVLASKALCADFHGITGLTEKISQCLTKGSELKITSNAGTDLICDIAGRSGNSEAGWCYTSGKMASPPDIESNIAPIENSADGVIIVDGSIPGPGLGLLSDPIELIVKKGIITHCNGIQSEKLSALFNSVGNQKSKILGEVGIGLNPLATINGFMLEDEGAAGSAHFGFGSNIMLGGQNNVAFHLDHIIRKASVYVDGYAIVREGEILIN